jgi:isoaspartyl peptidase/L-asparaginase-like protein (Ntn-hydrolase superfamily)
MPIALVVHGGAGLIHRNSLTPAREEACRLGLATARSAGLAVLRAGGTALDAVEAAVVVLEDNPWFNAGRGAVLTADGGFELDASVMDGATRAAGCVAGCTLAKNPIRAARAVMERTPHVLLAGGGADRFVQEIGLEAPPLGWFTTEERREQWEAVRQTGSFTLDHGLQKDVYGTVGAVACDERGHVAAATSTGGMVNKRPGRVGDSPILGAGTFAWDRTCAVSGTGHGEPFLRLGVAARVSAYREFLGLELAEAARRVIQDDLPVLGGQGGLIAVDGLGRIAMPFNTGGMFRAWAGPDGEGVAIW